MISLLPILPASLDLPDAVSSLLTDIPNRDAVREHVASVVDGQRALYARTQAVPPWLGYLALDEVSGHVVGSCSFVRHAADKALEIAYFTFPPYEQRGYGKAMATALVAIARADPSPPRLFALTLPAPGPSTRVLESLGFARAGTAIDDEAGEVWRWQLG